jgi:hypothetical protein
MLEHHSINRHLVSSAGELGVGRSKCLVMNASITHARAAVKPFPLVPLPPACRKYSWMVWGIAQVIGVLCFIIGAGAAYKRATSTGTLSAPAEPPVKPA